MKQITIETKDSKGTVWEDTYTIYPCRHIHHRWTMNGDGPKRAVRVKKNSFHGKRLRAIRDTVLV